MQEINISKISEELIMWEKDIRKLDSQTSSLLGERKAILASLKTEFGVSSEKELIAKVKELRSSLEQKAIEVNDKHKEVSDIMEKM